MTRKKVYITRKIDDKAIEYLCERFEVDINLEERIPEKEELINKTRDCDALLCLLSDEIDAALMDECKKLKIIANYAVGYNNIDISAARERNIVVTNTPDVLTDATAELTLALLFSAARRIVEGDRFTRGNKFKLWSPTLMLGQDICKKTLGVIGAGRIGKAFVKKTLGLEMKVLYNNRSRDLAFETETKAEYVSLDELLKESDFISIHVPLTSETKHMLGKREFEMMKKSAILINTSRGPVVDEVALMEALSSGEIWSAGLDVYEREPLIEEGLLALNNVVLLPHIGSATFDTRANMAMMAALNIEAVLNGAKGINEVV
jgi:glyoxylate reductase